MTGRLVTLEEAADTVWDVIVVGTGMGGATFGYAMARQGRRVLYCERGTNVPGADDTLAGCYPEEFIKGSKAGADRESLDLLQRAGRDSNAIEDLSATRLRRFLPFIGSGTGGSSALYGMAMERLFPSDFEPKRCHPNSTDDTLPERWPISYADMEPWYREAEALYRVRGTNDPLRPALEAGRTLLPPPPQTRESDWLSTHVGIKGLHPYRLPMACEFVDGCQGCQGYLCSRECKNDSSKICLFPAMFEHGASLVSGCRVTAVEVSGSGANGVVCEGIGGTRRVVHGGLVALAAGALHTPAILLRSTSCRWPNGLANASGMVGRNLMRHAIDLYALRLPAEIGGPEDNRQKQLAFNDFYDGKAGKLGSVQSFGRLPPTDMLFASMIDDLQQGPARCLVPLIRMSKPVLTRVLREIEGQRVILASTLEDLPHANNRVAPAGDGANLTLNYRLTGYQQQRVRQFRRLLSDALKPISFRLIAQANNNQRIAHACGTCRFGKSPVDSVLDATNRAHGVDNLFVVDASFFPSSGGTNPSLTIAANALRVAAGIAAS